MEWEDTEVAPEVEIETDVDDGAQYRDKPADKADERAGRTRGVRGTMITPTDTTVGTDRGDKSPSPTETREHFPEEPHTNLILHKNIKREPVTEADNMDNIKLESPTDADITGSIGDVTRISTENIPDTGGVRIKFESASDTEAELSLPQRPQQASGDNSDRESPVHTSTGEVGQSDAWEQAEYKPFTFPPLLLNYRPGTHSSQLGFTERGVQVMDPAFREASTAISMVPLPQLGGQAVVHPGSHPVTTENAHDGDYDAEDSNQDEFDEILQLFKHYEQTEDNESDVEVGGGEAEDGEFSDNEDDASVATLQQSWQPAMQAPEIKDFKQPVGPNHCLPDNAKPLDYFFLFLPLTFFTTAAKETNRYAQQRIDAKGVPDPLWKETTADEMRAYLAVLILMGINQKPNIWCYWSTDIKFNDPWISSVMSKTRFLKINQYFHLRDTRGAPTRDSSQYDPLFKVRSFINLILPKFRETYNAGRDLVVDEAVIGSQGRIFFNQYMPTKPNKEGIKVWELCEANTGYCLNFHIHAGRRSRQDTSVSLGHEVVTRLTSSYLNQQRHLYFDRFFASVPLMSYLLQNGTYACGTVAHNRKGLPLEVRVAKLPQRGDLLQMQKGPLMATVYKDYRQTFLLSTNQPPGLTTINDKRVPTIIAAYNQNMSGVNRSDQHGAYFPVGHANKKWWRYIFHSLVNLCVIQAFILWEKSTHNPPPKKGYDHLLFRADIAEQLRGGFTNRKRRAGYSKAVAEPPVALKTIKYHDQVKIDGRKRNCRQCDITGRRTKKGLKVETSYQCSFCRVPLCKVRDCFRDYHAENIVEGTPDDCEY